MSESRTSTARGDLFVISAPSGTGKNTLIREVIETIGSDGSLVYSVSYTTRSPRQGEVEGVNYHFVSRVIFEKMIADDAFLEFAEYNGNLYGTAKRTVLPPLEAGVDVILEIEVQGAELLLQRYPNGHAIFLLPPDFGVLQERLLHRGIDDPESMSQRLEVARSEIECYGLYQYAIINDDLRRASQALAAIIQDKRQRVARQKARISDILRGFRGSAPGS